MWKTLKNEMGFSCDFYRFESQKKWQFFRGSFRIINHILAGGYIIFKNKKKLKYFVVHIL